MTTDVDPSLQKGMAKKGEEALGLLLIMKPLFKRAGKLSDAEADVFVHTLRQVNTVMNDCMHAYWDVKIPRTQAALLPRRVE
jgi:hypothetical protein